MLGKKPPTRILSSACTTIEATTVLIPKPVAFGSDESSAKPVEGSSRAIRLRVSPPIMAKWPPAKILPSLCTVIEETSLSAFGSNESAKPLTGSSRAMRLRACPPMLFVPLKAPPAKILPSACTAIALTKSFAFGSKALSSVPSGFSLAMWLRVTGDPPLGESVVKPPPIRILPSGWTTTTYTGPFAFGSKPSSAEPPSVVGKLIFGWANMLENPPRPSSARKMPAKMINRRIKTRTLKNAD